MTTPSPQPFSWAVSLLHREGVWSSPWFSGVIFLAHHGQVWKVETSVVHRDVVDQIGEILRKLCRMKCAKVGAGEVFAGQQTCLCLSWQSPPRKAGCRHNNMFTTSWQPNECITYVSIKCIESRVCFMVPDQHDPDQSKCSPCRCSACALRCFWIRVSLDGLRWLSWTMARIQNAVMIHGGTAQRQLRLRMVGHARQEMIWDHACYRHGNSPKPEATWMWTWLWLKWTCLMWMRVTWMYLMTAHLHAQRSRICKVKYAQRLLLLLWCVCGSLVFPWTKSDGQTHHQH